MASEECLIGNEDTPSEAIDSTTPRVISIRTGASGRVAPHDFKSMKKDLKSRADASVPKAEALKHLSEDEKRGLEMQGEIEHAHGAKREQLTKQAEKKATGTGSHQKPGK